MARISEMNSRVRIGFRSQSRLSSVVGEAKNSRPYGRITPLLIGLYQYFDIVSISMQSVDKVLPLNRGKEITNWDEVQYYQSQHKKSTTQIRSSECEDSQAKLDGALERSVGLRIQEV